MAKRKLSQLQRIEFDHTITKERDAEFLCLLQRALLLALKERGYLNEMQCRQAMARLGREKG